MYPRPPAPTEVAEGRDPFCKDSSHGVNIGGWSTLTWGSGTKLLVTPGELSPFCVRMDSTQTILWSSFKSNSVVLQVVEQFGMDLVFPSKKWVVAYLTNVQEERLQPGERKQVKTCEKKLTSSLLWKL